MPDSTLGTYASDARSAPTVPIAGGTNGRTTEGTVDGTPCRIAEVIVTPVAFREPPLLAAMGCHQVWATRTILQVVCEDGTVGLSETYGDAATIADVRALAPRLAGSSVWDVHGLRTLVEGHARAQGAEGNGLISSPRTSPRLRAARLFAAFEVGLLDAAARANAVPLCTLLGGPSVGSAADARVPFAAYLFFKPEADPVTGWVDDWGGALSPEGVVAQARRMVERHGFRSLKLKGGVMTPEVEIGTLHALKEAFPDHPLRIDPNGNWSSATTLALLPELEELVEYLEDPVLGTSAMAAIQAETDLPLATNMCVTSFEDLPEALGSDAVRILLADHHFWGGLRATLALDRLCAAWGLPTSMHSNSHLGVSLMAMAHVGAACPNMTRPCDTHYVWTDGDVLHGGPVRFERGSVVLTERPGLGVDLDPEALAMMADDHANNAPPFRDDVVGMMKLQPDWSPKRPRY